MKAEIPQDVEEYRVTRGPMRSIKGFGFNGAFLIPYKTRTKTVELSVIVSDGDGWDHVSVSTEYRCPTYNELKFIKGLFFDDAETVVHFFPKQSAHINTHPFCLHLWRKQGSEYELPPLYMV
jgi:hypothetical protein